MYVVKPTLCAFYIENIIHIERYIFREKSRYEWKKVWVLYCPKYQIPLKVLVQSGQTKTQPAQGKKIDTI